MLNGGSVEKRWQPISADKWNLPVSRSRIFIAENTGRSGQPTQKPGGRAGSPPRRSEAFCFKVFMGGKESSLFKNHAMPVSTTSPVDSPAIASTSLPLSLQPVI